jgi:hypothetical protein
MPGTEDAPPRGTELASKDLLSKILMPRWKGKGRRVVFASAGSDELRYLDFMKAWGNVGGEEYRDILLREDARKIEAWEEFLHGTQYQCGVIPDRPTLEPGTHEFIKIEIHVKKFMIRHAKLIGITGGDLRVLQDLLASYE